MFSFIKKKESSLYSPVVGNSLMLEEVPDKVFSTKLMGDGIAFDFEGSEVCSPCDGEVIMISKTNHAIGFRTIDGVEVLLHVGMDTVNLGGAGLFVHVGLNQKVKHGQKIITIDREFMREKGINLLTPLIITNNNSNLLYIMDPQKVTTSSVVIEIKK